jgi:hypothetical protein
MPAPHFAKQDECLFTGLAMKAYGGSFAAALGEAFLLADLGNRQRLIEALPWVFNNYGPGSDWFKDAQRDYYASR